jgi:hypothetical protein
MIHASGVLSAMAPFIKMATQHSCDTNHLGMPCIKRGKEYISTLKMKEIVTTE